MASPQLTGTVDDPTAAVTVTVRGTTYTAVNNGDGTWTLSQGTIAPLPNGLYKPTIEATDHVGNQRQDDTSYLLVDSTGPLVTVDKTITTDTTPALSGTINDNTAGIVVTVNSVAYDALNNGNGTWTLSDNTVAALDQGVYTVTVAATNVLGNTGTANGVLSVASTVNVTLGAGISSATYFDADGTKVTLTAGTGNLNVAFTGVNVSSTGTGKTRTLTATGGVMNVAVDVAASSQSLSVKTAQGGDGLATISSITGSGILGSLSGSNLIVAGDGIDMAGRIQSINVYGITADVVMNAATLATKGVAITASVIRDCTVQTAYINSLSVLSLSKNANVTATAITSLSVKGGFENSNITASTINAATLYNVVADNGGVPFGLTVASLKKLTLKQGKTTLVWGKDFTRHILDLFVLVSSAQGSVWNVGNGIIISDQYIDNAGPTQRLLFRVQSAGGTGGIIALTNTRFTLTGGGTIGQELGDLSDSGVENANVDSFNQNLTAVASVGDFPGIDVYSAALDSHSLSGFSAVFGVTSPTPAQWFLSTCAQNALPVNFTEGVAAPVSIVQVVIPDGVILGDGLSVQGVVQTCPGTGQPITKTTFLITAR